MLDTSCTHMSSLEEGELGSAGPDVALVRHVIRLPQRLGQQDRKSLVGPHRVLWADLGEEGEHGSGGLAHGGVGGGGTMARGGGCV